MFRNVVEAKVNTFRLTEDEQDSLTETSVLCNEIYTLEFGLF